MSLGRRIIVISTLVLIIAILFYMSTRNHMEETPKPLSMEADEGREGYRPGGYHPICIGDTFESGRYVVMKKLGWGHFSTVWLTYDHQEKQYVSLKVQKSASHYTDAALDEIKFLKQIHEGDDPDAKYVVQLYDTFYIYGPHGKHVAMVFEVLGSSMLSLIKHYNYQGIPLSIVKCIAKDILRGLHYLHDSLKIIHTDLKPENVLLRRWGFVSPSDEELKGFLETTSVVPDQFRSCRDPEGYISSSVPTTLTKNQRKRLRQKQLKQLKKLQQDELNNDVIESCTTTNSSLIDSPTKSLASLHVSTQTSAIFETQPQFSFQARHLPPQSLEFQDMTTRDNAHIVDLGNACWTYKHFTDDIQTRQYRSPEVLLGAHYDTSADIWSLACMIFELATGDLLFDPRTGDGYDRNEDHLALIMELLGPIPKSIALGGKHSKDYFNRHGELRHIHKLQLWPLDAVLEEKYHFSKQDAQSLTSFLLPMLSYDLKSRITAKEALKHSWLDEC